MKMPFVSCGIAEWARTGRARHLLRIPIPQENPSSSFRIELLRKQNCCPTIAIVFVIGALIRRFPHELPVLHFRQAVPCLQPCGAAELDPAAGAADPRPFAPDATSQ